MFSAFFEFEVRSWLRGPMTYVFFLVFGLLVFAMSSSDGGSVSGISASDSLSNAPFVIEGFYAAFAFLMPLVSAAYVTPAATKDFTYDSHQLIFSQPIGKSGYFWGRFFGSTLGSVIPFLGIGCAFLVAPYMPWAEQDDWGAVHWLSHACGIIVLLIPNAILFASLIYSIAIITRSNIASFLAAIVLFVCHQATAPLLGNLEHEQLAVLLDPFGLSAFKIATKYWTETERNTGIASLTGTLLVNRLLWLTLSALVLSYAYTRFSFVAKERGRRTESGRNSEAQYFSKPVNDFSVGQKHGFSVHCLQFGSQLQVELKEVMASRVFICLTALTFLLTVSSLFTSASVGFGVRSFPVTYQLVDGIRHAGYLILLASIVYYSGALVWKERDARFDEVFDSTPHPSWIAYAGKVFALILMVVILQSTSILAAIIVQTAKGFTHYQLSLYVSELLGWDLVHLICLIVLAILVQSLSANKYIGYFVFIVLLILNSFGWGLLGVQSQMVRYGGLPAHVYSDFYGLSPYLLGMSVFSLYWLFFAALLSAFTVSVWRRGKDLSLLTRATLAIRQSNSSVRYCGLAMAFTWAALASVVFYNAHVLNRTKSAEETNQQHSRYETQFRVAHFDRPQPRVQSIRYAIDIYPERRAFDMRGEQLIQNMTDDPIREICVTLQDGYETELSIENAELSEEYVETNFRVYRLKTPLLPGDSTSMEFTVEYAARGFENAVSNTSIVQNGSFFNNMIAPQIGYQSHREISDEKERRKLGLGPAHPLPMLSQNNFASRSNHYLSNSSDWVEVETTISTSADQIAIAPGSLQKTWEQNGRRFFHYKLDHASVNFYAFLSGRYQVAVRKWREVDLEVYYHADHEWNVGIMLDSMRRSLEYYSDHFGEYRHKQARIIEFPRVARLAQAFPGTMPYSESMGFIADVANEQDINMVFYVVAHEMAHQWWAHQVIGANMEGATMLSETLAQYSALMVMEKRFGRDMMREFLRYEMDRYFRGRSKTSVPERPLKRVLPGQGYAHYSKGSCVMYYLKEIIGEDAINRALQRFAEEYAYQTAPYPTSADLIDALKLETPPDKHYLFVDLFDEVTFFANRTTHATCREMNNGDYEVTIEVQCKKTQLDKSGKEVEVPLDDLIDVGAFALGSDEGGLGATLHRELVRVTQPKNTISFVVGQRPTRAGIDPFALLIDRQPDDNLTEVVMARD